MDEMRITIEDMARMSDRPAWLVARSIANAIEKGLVEVEGGTSAEAVKKLRDLSASYGEATAAAATQ